MKKILKLNIFLLVEKIVRFLVDCGPQIRIALFTNMRIPKFRSQPFFIRDEESSGSKPPIRRLVPSRHSVCVFLLPLPFELKFWFFEFEYVT